MRFLLEIELRSVPYAPPQTVHEVVNFVVTWGQIRSGVSRNPHPADVEMTKL